MGDHEGHDHPTEEPPAPTDGTDVLMEGPNYYKRELLAVFNQHDGIRVEVLRYYWKPHVVAHFGYKSCIRVRRKWKEGGFMEYEENLGIPETDWAAFMTVLKEMKL